MIIISIGDDENANLKLLCEIHARHGWDLPPRTNPRIRPLE